MSGRAVRVLGRADRLRPKELSLHVLGAVYFWGVHLRRKPVEPDQPGELLWLEVPDEHLAAHQAAQHAAAEGLGCEGFLYLGEKSGHSEV